MLATALGMGAEPDGDEAPAMTAYIAHLVEALCCTMRHPTPAPTSSSSDEEDVDTGETPLLTRGDFKEAIHHALTMAEAAKLEQILLEQRALLPQASVSVLGNGGRLLPRVE